MGPYTQRFQQQALQINSLGRCGYEYVRRIGKLVELRQIRQRLVVLASKIWGYDKQMDVQELCYNCT